MENYAINKEEATSFQSAIKKYHEVCVRAERACVEKQEQVGKSVSKAEEIRDEVKRSKDELAAIRDGVKRCNEELLAVMVEVKRPNYELSKEKMSSKRELSQMVARCKRNIEYADRTYAGITKKSKVAEYTKVEIEIQYERVIFTAMNGRDLFESALEVLWTATEVMKANNEMVHHLREATGNWRRELSDETEFKPQQDRE